jgi:hypothetical protein
MARFPAACLAATGAAALLLGLVTAPRAAAATDVKYGLTDDAWLLNGSDTLESRLARLDALGVRVVRFTLHWDQIAASEPASPADPSDPAYDWTADDAVLAGLHAHGMDVVLQLVGTPGWANGGLAANYAPTSATSFRAFASAAARKYPWVRRWLIWNEPNQVRWLRPTAPAVYTSRLLNPAYAAIHAAIPSALVAGGGTAPRGSTGGVSPVAWLLGMHAAHARLDAYAHNPYPLDPKRETPLTSSCTACTTITMGTIGKLVALVAGNFPRARIWLTEYGYQTNPPDRVLGVSPALQARYVGEGAYAAYRAARVDLLIHFLYRDEPQLSRFQSGLVTRGYQVKPAFAAFEVPLAQTSRSGAHVSLWGQLRAPAAAKLPAQLEQKIASGWQPLASLRAGAGGYVRWTGVLTRGAVVRLRAGVIAGAPLLIA